MPSTAFVQYGLPNAATNSRFGSLGSTSIIAIVCFFFFFNDTATTEIYTLSLHDALPISFQNPRRRFGIGVTNKENGMARLIDNALGKDIGERLWSHHSAREGIDPAGARFRIVRSEEHTSELQSLAYLVCRLLLEKKIFIAIRKDAALIRVRALAAASPHSESGERPAPGDDISDVCGLHPNHSHADSRRRYLTCEP